MARKVPISFRRSATEMLTEFITKNKPTPKAMVLKNDNITWYDFTRFCIPKFWVSGLSMLNPLPNFVLIAAAAVSGPYRVMLVVYRPGTFARVSAYDARGIYAGDQIELTRIWIR